MKRFKLLVYTSDPAISDGPPLEYEAIAESQFHATKLLMDELGNLAWRTIQANDAGDAPDERTPRISKTA